MREQEHIDNFIKTGIHKFCILNKCKYYLNECLFYAKYIPNNKIPNAWECPNPKINTELKEI